jgi:superfamily I DNA and/or RNA helicase
VQHTDEALGDIAILTGYTAQLNCLRKRIGSKYNVEIGKMDSMQEREKRVIYLILVTTEEVGFFGEFDRASVAISRA